MDTIVKKAKYIKPEILSVIFYGESVMNWTSGDPDEEFEGKEALFGFEDENETTWKHHSSSLWED